MVDIKEQETMNKLSSVIPTSIYEIIFEFQLLIETWNKELSHTDYELMNDYENAQ